MTMLSAIGLANMRAAQDRTLNETATIRRPVQVGAGQENESTAPVLVAENVACNRSLLGNPTKSPVAERLMGRTAWVIKFAHGQDVQDDDEIEIASVVYSVIGPMSGGAWATATRVAVVLLRG